LANPLSISVAEPRTGVAFLDLFILVTIGWTSRGSEALREFLKAVLCGGQQWTRWLRLYLWKLVGGGGAPYQCNAYALASFSSCFGGSSLLSRDNHRCWFFLYQITIGEAPTV
jgi:hypothetical protein